MARRLPFELLTDIAACLETKDKLICATVCKEWTQPFQDSIWNTLDINSSNIEAVCNPLNPQNYIYAKNGYRVEKLCMGAFYRLNDAQLLAIQKCFNAPKYVSLQLHSLDRHAFGRTADWNLWKSLTQLDLFIPELDPGQRNIEMLRILACLPRLTRLAIEETFMKERGHYTWRTLEAIHACLPRLSYLHTSLPMDQVDPNDIQYIKSVVPANTMTRLNMMDHNLDVGWLYYLSLKYPNLSSVFSQVKYSIQSDQTHIITPEQRKLVSEQSHHFGRLKTATIKHTIKSFVESGLVWRSLYQAFGSLERLFYTVNFEQDISELPQEEVGQSVGFSSNTLKSVHIVIKTRSALQLWTPLRFGVCPRLVKLNIGACHGDIHFDLLLQNCRSLKIFILRGGSLRVALDNKDWPCEQYGLEKIDLWASRTSPDVFNFISAHCSRACNLALKYVKVTRKTFGERVIMLDMAHTGFDTLEFKHTDFLINSNTHDHLYQSHTAGGTVYLIALEKVRSADCGDCPKGLEYPDTRIHSHDPLWLYYQPPAIGARDERCIRQLKDYETEFVNDYFGLSKGKTHLREDIDYDLLKDVRVGFVRLRCRYIKDLWIDEQRILCE
ncbi:hypothetical protein CLU79DRAFT_186521 [Phycomyces nitens]|nr:hypothetical protein CLU79DRAFT_186521 [Phycomyces nitens]